MHIGRRIAAAGLGGVLVLLPAGSQASGLPVGVRLGSTGSGVRLGSTGSGVLPGPQPRTTAPSAATSVVAAASVLPSGRLRLVVRTNAARVTVRYVVSGRSTRSMSLPVRNGQARVTLPASATSARVRGAAQPGRRATPWQRLQVPPRWPQDVAPTAEQVAELEQQLLALVNEVRASGATCPGDQDMPAVPALTRNPAMDQAAREQSGWQAQTGILSHTGSAGSTVGQRITASGYSWTRVAEVVSAGYPQPAATLDQWLGSSGHCRALLDPGVTETGLGYAFSETSTYRHFWTLDLARA